MKRREFLAASVATVIGLSASERCSAADAAARQYFELRVYRFATLAKMQAYEEFLAKAAVPALNRSGVNSVGVFKLVAAENPSLKLKEEVAELRLLLPHDSIESVLMLESKLAGDEKYQVDGKEVLNAGKADAAFARYDSTLLWAMEKAPRLIVPEKKADTRVFELRTYESPNQERAKNKLEMFNAGEFPIFGKANMPGVFFGGAIAGVGLPQLTYMIVHNDIAEVKANWSAFGKDADWKKLSAGAGYKGNVSKVISMFIRPSAASQL